MVARSALVAGAAGVALAAAALVFGQDGATEAHPGAAMLDGEVLMKGLQATPGCLGVDAAQTMSGKSVIFAWFENKSAAMAWFNSETHQNAMKAGFPEYETAGVPMEGIPENTPIMAIAALTPGEKPEGAPGVMPVSQISIELYTPLKGGIHYGGTFAPAGLKVKAMRDLQKR
jgi:hypothetical protein